MRRKGPGSCTMTHWFYMSAKAGAIMVFQEQQPDLAPGGGGWQLLCAEKLTPGDLGAVLGPEPSKEDSCQVGTSGSQPPTGRGT